MRPDPQMSSKCCSSVALIPDSLEPWMRPQSRRQLPPLLAVSNLSLEGAIVRDTNWCHRTKGGFFMKVETEIIPEFLSFEAAGEYVCASKWSVRRWVKVGLLPASRVGQLVRVKRSDLDELMASRRTIAGGPA